ncbi:hypothetical protein tloyanaT_03520 [Thalassotalea loyana]|uniref:Uncharacterized protein n=1 Tax=Thalassotalea loyana TaxID=280483 RepID=A0ABQ6HBF9_9GAMM|nr:hypothetical protein tloyanaT_03520 [Thalassotalea loyana]
MYLIVIPAINNELISATGNLASSSSKSNVSLPSNIFPSIIENNTKNGMFIRALTRKL